ncbi:MAG: hypothetical protein U0790_09130 [Isosphaeraceae bacterium]
MSSVALAVAPKIGNISPAGVRRGEASAVTIQGEGLSGNARLITPFSAQVEAVDAKKSSATAWTFNLKIPEDVAVGVYPVRIQTDDGVSNPFLLAVGQYPQILEKEDNSTFEAAQPLAATPVIVEGQAAGNDVDYFRFAGKKGEYIVIDAACNRIGSGVDPSIRLTSASATRRFVASADDTLGLLTDARIIAQLPEDGEYVIELSDSRYQGGGRPVYRLLVGPVPLAEEVYPLGGRLGETVGLELRGGTLGRPRIAAATLTPAQGTSLHWPRIPCEMAGLSSGGMAGRDVESVAPRLIDTVPELREPADPAAPAIRAAGPVIFNGRIDPPGDEDRFVVAATPGQRLHVAVEASRVGSALDGVLQVLDAKGAAIATADDTNVQVPGQPAGQGTLVYPDPALDVTVPGGSSEITFVLRDLEGRGGIGFPYRMVVTPIVPGFELTASDAQVSIPKGGSVGIGVAVTRKDYAGPISLTVVDPPAGLTVRPGTIAPGQAVGALSIAASPTATFAAVPLRLVGRAQGPNGPIEVDATRSVVFAQQGTLPTNSLTQTVMFAAPALPTPVALDAPAEPIEVVHGFGAAIPVKLTRSKGADAALAVTPLPLPPGFAVPAANLAEKSSAGSVPVNTTVEAALGQTTIALVAKGKLPDGERTISIPAVTLNVVRPAEASLAAAAIEVKAGATAEAKGKLVRRGPFKDPVTVKLNGLPGGLKADPVVIAPGDSEFAIKIQSDPKAPAATATAQLAISYQVNKKDYPTPPLPLTVKVLPAR